MSSAPVAALIVVLTLAAVLLTSGVAKVRDPQATRDAFLALRVAVVGAAAPALPWVEIALAVLLLAAPSRMAGAGDRGSRPADAGLHLAGRSCAGLRRAGVVLLLRSDWAATRSTG